jgi:hypothetical protein
MKELRIHKRRVPVQIQLATRKSLDGNLYSELHRPDGTPANVVDRLNDPSESFVPLAAEDTHYLLAKSRIVSVKLQPKEIDVPAAEGVKELCVHIVLSTGTSHEGRMYAYLPPARSRVLDYLNGTTRDFIPVWCDSQVIAVNVDYIASVTETVGVEH